MRFQVMRASAAALAVSVALAGGASAQQTPAKPAAPGSSSSAGPGGAGRRQPAPPSKVDLVSPEPQWAKFCAKEPASGRDACATMRDFSTSADQPPMISINLFDVAGEERRKLRFLILPIGMLLKPGFRVIIDKNEPIEGKYDMCFQNACSAEIDIGAKTLETLKKGQNMAVVMRVPGGDVVRARADVQHSAEGFGSGVRRQADRPQGAGTAAPGVAAAVAEEGGRTAQSARAAARWRAPGGASSCRTRRSSSRRSGEVIRPFRPLAIGGRPGARDTSLCGSGFLRRLRQA